MSALLQGAAAVVAVAALVAAMAVLVSSRQPALALRVLLDLLLAAGLLRLAAVDDWPGVLAAAAIVVVRRVVTVAYRRGAGAATPAPPATQ
jgi:hypothetical protein